MKNKSRITSILKTKNLDFSITGLPSFNLSELNLVTDFDFQLPTNLRLGHLAERIVSELIKASTNYNVLYESIQLIEDKKTIGEIDFILEDIRTKQLIHMELAYKFYLFDPSISSKSINNWIGPNRNDSLKDKLEKLKRKQFPLLYHHSTGKILNKIKIDTISQTLCLLVSLFIPYEYSTHFNPLYEKYIKGYYLDLETFISLNHPDKTYYIPAKTEWGMNPSENEIWFNFSNIEQYINTSTQEKKALLCWQKYSDSYLSFFITWW